MTVDTSGNTALKMEAKPQRPVDLSKYAEGQGIRWLLESGTFTLAPNLVLLRAMSMQEIMTARATKSGLVTSGLGNPMHAPLHEIVQVGSQVQKERPDVVVGNHCVHRSASADFVDGLDDESPYVVVDAKWLSLTWDPHANGMTKTSIVTSL